MFLLNNVKKVFLILLMVSLTACSIISNQTVFRPQTIEPEKPRPIEMRPVQWEVIMVTKNGVREPRFSLDNQNYTNLSENLIDIARFIEQQNSVISFYQNLIAERSVSNTVSNIQPVQPVEN